MANSRLVAAYNSKTNEIIGLVMKLTKRTTASYDTILYRANKSTKVKVETKLDIEFEDELSFILKVKITGYKYKKGDLIFLDDFTYLANGK